MRVNLILALFMPVVLLVGSFFLRIRDVRVNEIPALRVEQVKKITGIRPGKPLWKTPFLSGKRRLLRHPWVRAASVRLNWDLSVSIRIVPRTPFACFVAQKHVLVDESGVILEKGDSCGPHRVLIKDLYHQERNFEEGKLIPDPATRALLASLREWHSDPADSLSLPPPSSLSIHANGSVSIEKILFHGASVLVVIQQLKDAAEAVRVLKKYSAKFTPQSVEGYLYFYSPHSAVWK
ncbi:MAG: cell division protein FtsQ/DivIB [bacterium JZ-2024 1]